MRRSALALALALMLLMSGSPAAAATAHVQHASGKETDGTTAAVFGSNVTAGNLIAVCVAWEDTSSTLSSVTDTLGNTYTLLNNPTSSSFSRMALAYAKNIGGGANTVTATMSGAIGASVAVHEISGADTSDPVNDCSGTCSGINNQGATGTGTDAVTSPSITTVTNGDYIFGCTQDDGYSTTITAGTGYTSQVTQAGGNGRTTRTESKIQSTAGAVTATFTQTVAGATFLTGIMAFKVASGVGRPPRVVGGGLI